MAKITNLSGAKQGVRIGGKLHWLKPKESIDKDMTAAELQRHDRHDFLKVEGAASEPAKLPDLTRKSKEALVEIAKIEGVTFADDATMPQIIEAIEAKRKG